MAGPKRTELRSTDEYRARRGGLSRPQRRIIGWAEGEIAEDPNHAHWRRPTLDGCVLDYSVADSGLLIKFRRAGDHVELVEIIDLRRPSAPST